MRACSARDFFGLSAYGTGIKNSFTLEIILDSTSIVEEKIFNVPKRFTDKGEIDMTLILFTSLDKYLKNLKNNLLFSKKNFLKYSNKSQYSSN